MNNDYLEGMTTVQQRNVTSIYEPQNPLYHKEKDAYFYPLTSEKQIVMNDGRRLNAVLEEDFAKKGEVNSAKVEAIDGSKVYTNQQVKKARPYNLLDNSDFTNPVNQRGLTSYTGVGYGIDRWQLQNSSMTVNVCSGYLELVNTTTDGTSMVFLKQSIENVNHLVGKPVTFSIKLHDGSIHLNTTMLSTSQASSVAIRNTTNGVIGYTRIETVNNGVVDIRVIASPGSTLQIRNCALYEGEYTIDTLPEYQPKGYGAELLICRQYDLTTGEYIGLRKFGQPRNLLDNSDFRNPVNQRGITTFTGSGYTIDRWQVWQDTITVGNGYVKANAIFQFLELPIDKVYTLTACAEDGSIAVVSGKPQNALSANNEGVTVILTNIGGYTEPIVGGNKNLIWAALYEGEYTIDTLPEYQSKGYGAELMECKRYFNQIREWQQTGVGAVSYDGRVANIVIPVGAVMNNPISVSGGKHYAYLRVNGQSIDCSNADMNAWSVGAYTILQIEVDGLTNYVNQLAEFDVGNTPMLFSAEQL